MAAQGLRGANDKWTLRCRSTSVSASILEVTPVEMPSSDRLLETQQTLQGAGRGGGVSQHLPLHWKRWVGVVSRSRSAMGSGLLQRAMPGSLYPAFTHSESQRRLQSQWSGLVPSALRGRAGSQAPPPSLAHRPRGLGPLEKQDFQTLARLGVSDRRTIRDFTGVKSVTPDCTSNPCRCFNPTQAPPIPQALLSPTLVRFHPQLTPNLRPSRRLPGPLAIDVLALLPH